jgi:hypothetical protein
MKTKHVAFFLVVAALVATLSVAPVASTVGGNITLSRAEFWRLGFGPVNMLSALLLAVASIAASRGSLLGFRLCVAWMGIVSCAFGVLLVCHFASGWSRGMSLTMIKFLLCAVVWCVVTCRWRIKNES